MKIVDQKRMQKRAWGSGVCASILTFFFLFQLGMTWYFPTLINFVWFVLFAFSTIVEWTSCFFWSQCDLRGPLWSGANQFWIGLLGGGNMIYKAYYPDPMGILANIPQAPLIQTITFTAYWVGGVLTILLQALVAYGFWRGGPRGYRPFQQGLLKSEPAKDWDA